jgi:protein disulfide isomerase
LIVTADLPTLVAVDMSGKAMKKYPFGGDLSNPNGASDFIGAFLAGELKPTLKSETPLPEDTTGPVKVLRGSSFNDIVLNNQKDVLVEFYAPWCGHCKKLAPTWDELGAKYANNDNVVIAKMDSTANEVDVDGLVVQGFPTIYFFPGQNKRPVKYENGRELEDFVDFLTEHATGNNAHEEL